MSRYNILDNYWKFVMNKLVYLFDLIINITVKSSMLSNTVCYSVTYSLPHSEYKHL